MEIKISPFLLNEPIISHCVTTNWSTLNLLDLDTKASGYGTLLVKIIIID
jgi:maleate cis-trans isomerase